MIGPMAADRIGIGDPGPALVRTVSRVDCCVLPAVRSSIFCDAKEFIEPALQRWESYLAEGLQWKKRQENVTTRHVIAGSAKAWRIAVNIVKMQERRLSFPAIVDTLAAPFMKSGQQLSCAFCVSAPPERP
jgi:hypothetical protein